MQLMSCFRFICAFIFLLYDLLLKKIISSKLHLNFLNGLFHFNPPLITDPLITHCSQFCDFIEVIYNLMIYLSCKTIFYMLKEY